MSNVGDPSVELAAFLVEHYSPGMTRQSFEAASARVRLSAERIADEGVPLRFVHAALIPEEETALCLFEATSSRAVEEAYARASVGYERIIDAVLVP